MDGVSWNASRLDLFGIGLFDAQLYHQYWTGTTRSPWLSLGGDTVNPPTAVSSQPGHVDVFFRNRNNRRVYTKHLHNDEWGDTEDLAGGISSSITAVSWGPAHVDIFALAGSDHVVPYVKTMNNGTWGTKWIRLDGQFKSELAAVSWGVGRIDVFAIGLDDAMWQRTYDSGKWSEAWESLGGNFSSPPVAVSFAEGRLDVFAIDSTYGTVTFRSYINGEWNPWWNELGGGDFQSSISASATPLDGGTIDIFVLGTEDTLYKTQLTGGYHWNPSWTSHGQYFDTAPKVVTRADGRIDVLGLGKFEYASAYHQAWDASNGWQPSIDGWDFDGGSFQKFD